MVLTWKIIRIRVSNNLYLTIIIRLQIALLSKSK